MGELCSIKEFNDTAIELLQEIGDLDFDKKYELYDQRYGDDTDLYSVEVKDKVEQLLTIIHRWNNYMYNEKMLVKKLKGRLEDFREYLTKRFKTEDDPRNQHMNDKMLAIKIKKQPVMVECQEYIERQEMIVDYIINCFENLKDNFKNQLQMMVELIAMEQ